MRESRTYGSVGGRSAMSVPTASPLLIAVHESSCELIENLPDLAVLIEPLLVVRRALREQFVILHRRLLALVRDDEVCRRLMTTPGVGETAS
jgi:transposase